MGKSLAVIFFMALVLEIVVPGGILVLPMPDLLRGAIQDVGKAVVITFCVAAAALCWVWD